jgi:hypothetical protein
MDQQNKPNGFVPENLFPQRTAYQPGPAIPQAPTPASQYVPPPIPPQMPPFAPAPVPHKNHAIGITIISLIVLFVAALAFAAFYLDLFASPKESVDNAVISFDSIERGHADLAIKLAAEVGGKTQTGNLTTSLDADRTDVNNPKLAMKMGFRGSGFSASTQIRFINKTLYVRVDEFPMLGMFGVNNIEGEWYSITEEDIENLMKQYGQASSTIDFGGKAHLQAASRLYHAFDESGVIGEIESAGISKADDGTFIRTFILPINKEKLVDAFFDLFQKSGKSEQFPVKNHCAMF